MLLSLLQLLLLLPQIIPATLVEYPFTNINFTETSDDNSNNNNNPFLNVLYNWSGQQTNNPDESTKVNTNTNSNTNTM